MNGIKVQYWKRTCQVTSGKHTTQQKRKTRTQDLFCWFSYPGARFARYPSCSRPAPRRWSPDPGEVRTGGWRSRRRTGSTLSGTHWSWTSGRRSGPELNWKVLINELSAASSEITRWVLQPSWQCSGGSGRVWVKEYFWSRGSNNFEIEDTESNSQDLFFLDLML